MLRRRRPSDAPVVEPGSARTRRSVAELVDAGWTLPATLTADRPPTATRIGVDGGPWTGVVDGRGAVSPGPGRPTLDWAVGGDDRWYVPATEPGVEQVRLDHAPVVETRMRVPGGHAVHRAYVARGASHPGGDEWVVVEVENASKLPIALAWLVRPWDATGLVALGSVTVAPMPGATDGSAPWQLWAGDLAAVLPRRPSRWAAGPPSGSGVAPGEDPLATVRAGAASADWPAALGVTSDHDMASLALLVPVPHTATATIVLPMGVSAEDADQLGWPGGRPEVEAIVRGWTAVAETGPRVELPDPVLADALAAARRSIVLSHRVERLAPEDDSHAVPHHHVVSPTGRWGRGADAAPVGEQMEILEALARWGQHETVDRALIDWPAGQQRGGGFGDEASTVAALRALLAHAVAAGDAGPARAWLPEVGGAVEWLGRRARKASADPRVLADGLDAGAVLFALLDQPQAAAAMARDAASVRSVPGTDRTRDLDAPGTTPRAVAAAAVVATRAGESAEAVWALLRRASSTWTWPDPERWVGDDGLVAARLLTAVGRLLVQDHATGLALTTWMPPAWWGLGWEVHDVPTRWGRLGYAVRWHSGRPALLWDLGEPLEGLDGDPVLTAPGLDPAWSTTERRGEALLAAVAPPEGVETGPDVATGGVAVAAPPRSVWRPEDPGPDAPTPSSSPATSSAPDGPADPPDDDPGTSFL